MHGALAYYGGKSPVNGIGPWIARQLPLRGSYCEPFAGMLGVLLCRVPSHVEIVSDANHDVIHWWNMVRDHHDELTRRVSMVLWHRDELMAAKAVLESDEKDPMERAVAFQVAIQQSVASSPWRTGWSSHYSPNVGSLGRWNATRFAAIHRRIRKVQFETRDAAYMLERTAKVDDIVVYADPPYGNADTSPYGDHRHIDRAAIADLLRAQRGFVAVSGYGDDWDCLDWRRSELTVEITPYNSAEGRQEKKPRTEVLWTNAPKPHDLLSGLV